jgi:protease I
MADLVRRMDGSLADAKIAVLVEGDWFEPELTFLGHEYRAPLVVNESFEDKDVTEYDAIIVPGGIVADRLRFTEDVNKIPPATEFLKKAFAEPGVLKGIICHGMWLVAPAPELVRGRRVVVHNNLIGDAKNMGAIYVDQDVVVDGDDLVTGRTGQHAHVFSHAIIEQLRGRRA